MDAIDPFLSLSHMNVSDLRPDGPTHSPAWRWYRARLLFETKAPASAGLDDFAVRRARDFLAMRAEPAIAPSKKKKKTACPDASIEAALELARDADPLRRGELEAYLLTEERFDEVARRFGLAPGVVTDYHSLFFSVRDHPLARNWIVTQAVRCGPWNDFAGPHPVGTWKYGGFSGGAPLVELLVAITTDRPFPAWIREIFRENADEYERRLRLMGKATIGMMTSRCQSEIEQLIAIRSRLARLDEKVRQADMETAFLDARTSILESVFGGAASFRSAAAIAPRKQKPGMPAASKRRRKPRHLPSNPGPSPSGGKHVTD